MKTQGFKKIKNDIFKKVKHYYKLVHRKRQKAKFTPGKTKIHYAGRVYNEKELINLVDSALDFWLTAGPYAKKAENKLCNYFQAKKFYLLNSGSSANLAMISAVCSDQFEDRLKPGDEVITPAVTFPTTLTPIIQNRLVPVFVDCEVGTYNIDPYKIEDAISPKTKAIFIPHTLGNPCNMDIVLDIVKRKKLILFEDACDAFGSKYDKKLVGTFGSMASLSFYPAHHMTMGEGGGVIINDRRFTRILLSIRDWGRDCWCETGSDNTCKRRFHGKYGTLPFGYDHKYVYSNLGYNLKITDMQAAIGLAQLAKIEKFIQARKNNFIFYYENLKFLESELILPEWQAKADPAWFGFPITVRNKTDANKLIEHLEKSGIETRRIFAGNVLRQPGFTKIAHRVYGNLRNSDIVMQQTFFIGVYPGLAKEKMQYVVNRFNNYYRK